jgi:hypothetical protein
MELRNWLCARAAACAVLVALLVGCASTSLVNQWKSPDFAGPPLRKVLVVGVSKQPTVRRVFEDEMVARLAAHGVGATQSYAAFGEAGQADQAQLEGTVKQLGVDSVLITRLVKRETNTQMTGGYYGPGGPNPGFYGWYSSAWMGYYDPPTAYQYDVVTLETSVYGVQQRKLLWSGTTESFAPTDIKKEIAAFSEVVVGALRKQGLVP